MPCRFSSAPFLRRAQRANYIMSANPALCISALCSVPSCHHEMADFLVLFETLLKTYKNILTQEDQQSTDVCRVSGGSVLSVIQSVRAVKPTYRSWQWRATFHCLKRVIAQDNPRQHPVFSSRNTQRLQGYLSERNSKTRKQAV